MGGFDVFDLVPVLFVLVGAAAAISGVRAIGSESRLRRRALRASGVVTGLRARRVARGRSFLCPVVAFTTADGRDVQATAPTGSDPPRHREGQRVDVMYDPADPSEIRLGTGVASQVGAIALVPFGLVFAIAGLVWLLR